MTDRLEDLEKRMARIEAMLPSMIPKSALDIFASDPHRFSERGCGTCKDISSVIGEPWGCVALARKKRP